MTAAPKPPHREADEQRLLAKILSPEIRFDPFAYAAYVYPWGEPGTILEGHPGPKRWQAEELRAAADYLAENRRLVAAGKPPVVYRASYCTGHGPGKSALFAMLANWMFDCHIGSSVVMAANKEDQLKTKTFAEVRKWRALGITRHWAAEPETLAIKPATWLALRAKEQLGVDPAMWMISGETWQEQDPDAFAGKHNMYGLMVLFDEASGIPTSIFRAAEGYFTDLTINRFWLVSSNPRQAEGEFQVIHTNEREMAKWRRRTIDSRTVEGLDHAYLQGIVDRYGEDSYEGRVMVRGLFPDSGEDRFFDLVEIDRAIEREPTVDPAAALILGADIARFGDDETVVRLRRGRDARSFPSWRWRGSDTMESAAKILDIVRDWKPDHVCVEGAGVGAGVVDRLRHLGVKVEEIQPGGGPLKSRDRWLNRRTELAALAMAWLAGGCLPNDHRLREDLRNIRKKIRKGLVYLEPKDEAKARKIPSPDDADALLLTFAVDPPERDLRDWRKEKKAATTWETYRVFGSRRAA